MQYVHACPVGDLALACLPFLLLIQVKLEERESERSRSHALDSLASTECSGKQREGRAEQPADCALMLACLVGVQRGVRRSGGASTCVCYLLSRMRLDIDILPD